YEAFGPQHWWPGETPFEIITGAILTQNTSWTNVEKAIANLKSAGHLSPEALNQIELARLAELIRPAGYYNIKARRLRNFLDWLLDDYAGNLVNLESVGTDQLRQELLAIKGVGRDAYTARIAVRHGLIEPDADYEQLRELFESNLARDRQLFNEYHALLVRAGKEFCKPKARCPGCPLEKLPHTVDVEYV
ncbi:MAG: endonuclease III domain-containing protein, partial [Planctomycetota bacterium]